MASPPPSLLLVRVRKVGVAVNDRHVPPPCECRVQLRSAAMTVVFSAELPTSPGELGIDEGALSELIARAQREIDEGHIPSCQIAFARHGKLAVWITLGAAEPESRYVIFSSTKPVVAGDVDPDGRRRDRRVATGSPIWSPSSRRTARTRSRSSR